MKIKIRPGTQRVALQRNQAVSLDAAPGTIVRALEGTIWLTQEALASDRILVAGTRFVSDSDGKIVLSSIDGPSVARVHAPGCRQAHAGWGLQVDSSVIARIEREAQLARSREILRLLRKLGVRIASAWHSLARRFSQPAAQH